MNITREDMPGRQVALTIELDPDTVNTALDKAYRQMVNQVNIPGFRRGKAPRYILERYVGRDELTERAVRNILPQTVQDAIEEQKIEALDVGDVEIVNLDPLQVKVIVIQPPVVELGDYGSIRVERETVEITPEQVEEVLTELRRESAPWNEPTEPRPIQEGDMVYVDLEGFTTAGPLEEASRDNFPTIVGVTRAGVPEVVNQALTGMSVGEEKDIVDTLPEDYPNPELQGKDVTYHLTIRSMKTQELPELDEEFAKKLNYDTVEALREAVENNLRQRSNESAESKQVNSVIEQMIAASRVEVPDVMVTEELDSMLKNLEDRLKQQRLTLRQYFTYNGVTEADWREANRERARERLVNNLVLQEFARREGLAVEDAEIDAEIQEMLGRFEGEERAQAEAVFQAHEARHEMQDRVFQRKLMAQIVGIAEGRIEAAPAPAPAEGTDSEATGAAASGTDLQADTATTGEDTAGQDQASGTATDLEEAGGAAELLSTGDVDTRSPLETGDATGGGTPEEAPALNQDEK
ncbi:MAG: trigger factor [Chloroflexota bacterium]|nr:trigger factor [Chloroflexota bacterium]